METEYFSARWMQGSPATVMLLMSSLLIPRLEPRMVIEIPPCMGPKRGMIYARRHGEDAEVNWKILSPQLRSQNHLNLQDSSSLKIQNHGF